ncbi:hypothetical protein SLS56_011209 [Neofusicoccum ribis]|uniref:Protein kinase domain-containing protein n=1 Tax=Neofusicoccum ribis TaxID=45134 RepID=A0ABR3SCC6_9PEZI
MKNERLVFDLLEQQNSPCPNIVRSFLRLPDLNFVQLLPGGTLEARLQSKQVRDPSTQRVANVTAKEPHHLVVRWMAELSDAAAWLESLGLAHGDIRPSNLLLDSKDHLKLSDFDNTARVGEEVDVGTAPYARILGPEAGTDCGTFGTLGPRTEQFAIGSVYYYLTRGYEPYDNERFGQYHGRTVVDMLQNMEFPKLEDGSEDDAIIKQCWHHRFRSIRDLAQTMASLNNGQEKGAESIPQDVFQKSQEECLRMVQDGQLTLWGMA